MHVGQQRDIDLVHKALHTGQASATKVDAQRAFDRLVARYHDDQVATTTPVAFSVERLIGIWQEINAYVVACGGTPPQPQEKSAANWAATDRVQAYLKGQR